ncbi:MAG TPA: alpha/beta fold hydrolase [Ktedonobacteraceae bacterium]|nr:alpha/beta fold hydrolase [Ktedonobacteraceae bacterium]
MVINTLDRQGSQKLWLPYWKAQKGSCLRLFCLHYAGGSASLFRQWQQMMPLGVEVCAIQLPGREARISEAPFSEAAEVVQALAQVLTPYLDMPFILFGHSMGALLSFELARQLRRENLPMPMHLFVSAHRAPQLPYRLPRLHDLEQDAFIQSLRRLSSIPAEVLANEEFLQHIIPLLRADFALCEQHSYSPERPLDCSISVFGGLADDRVTRQELLAWRAQTKAPFVLQMFPGDHFFLQSAQNQLVQVIADVLMRFVDTL